MGTPSYFNEQEIEVLNKEKLKELKERTEETHFNNIITDDLEIDFGAWDGRKIQGYWYNEMVDFLEKLSKCISGYAQFNYDGEYPFRIIFNDGDELGFQSIPEVDWEDVPINKIR